MMTRAPAVTCSASTMVSVSASSSVSSAVVSPASSSSVPGSVVIEFSLSWAHLHQQEERGSRGAVEQERRGAADQRGRRAGAVFPGLVFIEKLQNDDLTMTSLVALRRPNDDHSKVLGMTSFRFSGVLS